MVDAALRALQRWWLRCLVPDARARELLSGDLDELHRLRRAEMSGRSARFRLLMDLFSLVPARRAIRGVPGRSPSYFDHRRENLMNLVQDLRLAIRTLIRTPAYSAVVVITLALAIGANSAIFSVVDGVLLRPLPYSDPESLYLVREAGPGDSSGEPIASQRLFLAWRESGRSVAEMAMYSSQSVTFTGLAEPTLLTGAAVSPALFPLLQVDAEIGRTFAPDEESPGRDGVVILGHRAWQRYFGADPELVGREIRMDDGVRTVVGVMPAGFRFPDAETEFWVPMLSSPPEGANEDAMASASRRQQQGRRQVETRTGGPDGPGGGGGGSPEVHTMELWGRVVVRLAPDTSAAMAVDEGERLLAGLREGEQLEGREAGVELVSVLDQLVGPVERPLFILMGAVGFVLLIACANVVNLVMARSITRSRETAVRASLGAGWWRLAGFLFAESLVLASVGAVFGLVLAYLGLRALGALGPDFIPRLDSVAIDGRVVAFTALLTGLTATLTSLVPVRNARRLDLTRALKDDGARGSALFRGNTTRHLLVTVETAAAVVMLVGAGLMVSSFLRLTTIDHGYTPDGVLQVEFQLPEAAFPDAASHRNAYDALVERLEGLPAVRVATVASRMPSQPANIRVAIQQRSDDGSPSVDNESQPVGVRVVENGYFDAIGVQPLEGRVFEDTDRQETAPVMVLSESAATALFGDYDRIVGERLRLVAGEAEIVGIVPDVRTAGVDPTPQPDVFIPHGQAPDRMVPMLFRVANLLVLTDGDPLQAAPAIRAAIQQNVPGSVVLAMVPVRDTLADAVAEPRFYASLVGAFAALALALAAVGIYGLLAYTVQQGVRDTAIRRALGAPVERILRGVIVRGMSLAAVGLTIGVGASLLIGRFLESMLYEVEPSAPGPLLAVSAVFLAVAAVAVWIPARRAARIDPMDALRLEG